MSCIRGSMPAATAEMMTHDAAGRKVAIGARLVGGRIEQLDDHSGRNVILDRVPEAPPARWGHAGYRPHVAPETKARTECPVRYRCAVDPDRVGGRSRISTCAA